MLARFNSFLLHNTFSACRTDEWIPAPYTCLIFVKNPSGSSVPRV